MTDVLAQARELFDFDIERTACPYPTFAGLREEAPVVWFDEIESFVVTRYDVIVEVLKHPEIFSSRSATGPATDREMMTMLIELAQEDPEIAALAATIMQSSSAPVLLQADPPDHGRQRALVNRAFTPGAVRGMEGDIEQIAHRLIDSFIDRGHVELLHEFAVPLPMTVIAKALGVSLDRMDDFMRWSKTLVAGIGKRGFGKPELRDIMVTRAALAQYLHSVVVERAGAPQDDLISQLLDARIDGELLTHDEIVNMVVQFLLAGNDTTAKLIGAAMLRLAGDAEFADRLRAEPALVGPFVEEILRLQPPINGTYRVADFDRELGGVAIPAGSSIWLVYASGNRDPEQFADPDDLHCPQEAKTPHLAFGFGAHFCLGASLARAEGQIAVRALLERCADIHLAVDANEIAHEPSFMLHGLQSLPLAFTASARRG